MGRYYQTQTGKEGKFWFAVQPSDDPEKVYGMSELEYDDEHADEAGEGYGEWYVDFETADADYVKKQLDKQYDILGVPKDKRKYKIDDEGDYVWHDIVDYYLTEEQTKDEHGRDNIGYSMGDDKPTMYPISKEKELAASRVQLGLVVYNCILNNGYCCITADL